MANGEIRSDDLSAASETSVAPNSKGSFSMAIVTSKKKVNKPKPTAWVPSETGFNAVGIRSRTNYSLRLKQEGEEKVADLAENYVPWTEINGRDVDAIVKYLAVEPSALCDMLAAGANAATRTAASNKESRIQSIVRSIMKQNKRAVRSTVEKQVRAMVASEATATK